MATLTDTQTEILDYVREYLEEHKKAPTYDEIATGVGVYIRAVQHQLDRLEALGVVKRERVDGRCVNRSLSIVS